MLLELIIVVAIVGILSAVAMPDILGMTMMRRRLVFRRICRRSERRQRCIT